MTETQTTPKCHRRDVHPAHSFERFEHNGNTAHPRPVTHRCAGRETVAPPASHDAPLLPGEVRTHTVGTQTFKVQHVAGGNFTQATVTDAEGPTGVLATERSEDVAVRSYAAAIADAESAAAPAPTPGPFDRAIAELERFEEEDRAAVARGESANWWERRRSDEADALTYNLPDGFDPRLVHGETPTVRPEDGTPDSLAVFGQDVDPMSSLRTLVEAYGEAMGRAGIVLASRWGGQSMARPYAAQADAFKAEILRRFGDDS